MRYFAKPASKCMRVKPLVNPNVNDRNISTILSVETAIAPGGTKREIETDFSNRDRKHARFKLGKLA